MNWILLAQDHAVGGAEMDPQNAHIEAHWAAGVWAWVLFLVLVFLLWKFAFGPIVKGLEARENRIADSLKRAEEVERAAREINETNRKLMEKAQQDAQKIVSDARLAAKNAEADILAKAAAEVDAQRERFVRETQLLIDKAKDDLRKETVELTLMATSKMLGKSLTDADHRRLAEQSLRDAESVARN